MYKDELHFSFNRGEDSKTSRGESNIFVNIFKSVTSPSSMVLSINGKDNEKIITVLTALTSLVENAPSLFVRNDKSRRTQSTIKFVFDTVILGRDDGLSSTEKKTSKNSSDVDNAGSLTQSPESAVSSKASRSRSIDVLSLPCQRLCAAIDFISSHIRSTIRCKKLTATTFDSAITFFPSKEHISSVFQVLISVLKESGQPPSNRDRSTCKGVKELAAIRKCAAINLLRLCDRSLGLDDQFLSYQMWGILSSVFTDNDADVRGNNETNLLSLYCLNLALTYPSHRFSCCPG